MTAQRFRILILKEAAEDLRRGAFELPYRRVLARYRVPEVVCYIRRSVAVSDPRLAIEMNPLLVIDSRLFL